MSYLGNQPAANFASVTKDTFSGNGSTTAFTLSKTATTNGVAVYVENVRQIPTTAYTVSGTTLDFGSGNAPVSGTNNIYVLHHNAVASTATHPAAQDLTAVNGTFTGTVTAGSTLDMNGTEFILDADADTSITADTDDRIDFRFGGTDSVHMDVTGVGVNVTNPLYPFHARAASGGDTAALFLEGPNDGYSTIYLGDTDDIDIAMITYRQDYNWMQFQTNNAVRMTINSDGRLGIGDTGQSNVMTTITENSDTDITGLKVTTGATGHDGITIWSVQGNTSSTLSSTVLYGGYSNSAHKFLVRGDGDIETAGAQSLSGISDVNFKENIVDANSQWDDIKALKVRNYSWKEDKLDKADKIGLIAQEAELVSPNLVFTRDKINDIQYIKDENGKDIDNPEFGKKVEGETYKTLKYSVLYTKALKALQEAMTRIETLEAEVAKLKE
jgi:hypothetical protein